MLCALVYFFCHFFTYNMLTVMGGQHDGRLPPLAARHCSHYSLLCSCFDLFTWLINSLSLSLSLHKRINLLTHFSYFTYELSITRHFTHKCNHVSCYITQVTSCKCQALSASRTVIIHWLQMHSQSVMVILTILTAWRSGTMGRAMDLQALGSGFKS